MKRYFDKSLFGGSQNEKLRGCVKTNNFTADAQRRRENSIEYQVFASQRLCGKIKKRTIDTPS
jgi:hypothetical protein